MKYTTINLILFISLLSQNLISQHKIDGSITYLELTDTTQYRTIISTDEVIIREGKDAYYLGIKSNRFTISNLFIMNSEDEVTILHSSFSLGTARYRKNDSLWQPTVDEYTWEYRDPILGDFDTAKTVQEHLNAFFARQNWKANTAPAGSHREMEYEISKQLLSPEHKLIVSFVKSVEGENVLTLWPDGTRQITKDKKFDLRLYNGYLEKDVEFDPSQFKTLKDIIAKEY